MLWGPGLRALCVSVPRKEQNRRPGCWAGAQIHSEKQVLVCPCGKSDEVSQSQTQHWWPAQCKTQLSSLPVTTSQERLHWRRFLRSTIFSSALRGQAGFLGLQSASRTPNTRDFALSTAQTGLPLAPWFWLAHCPGISVRQHQSINLTWYSCSKGYRGLFPLPSTSTHMVPLPSTV